MGLKSENPEEKERHTELVNELRDVLEQKKVLKSVEMFSTVETNRGIMKIFKNIKFLFLKKQICNELSFCHKLWLSNPFQTINSVKSKYQRYSKDIGIRKFESVAKTQFLCRFHNQLRFLNPHNFFLFYK